NYFTDNNPPVGQTFTTGTNALNVVSVVIKTAGLNSGNGYGTPTNTPTYYLRIYSMSNTSATLLVSVSAARLVSVAIKTAGLNSGNGYGTPTNTPTYYLRIYSMSGSTATLLVTVSAPNP